MLFSLIVALTITPYLAYRILWSPKDAEGEHMGDGEVNKNSAIYKIYSKTINPLLDSRPKRWGFLIVTTVLLLGSMAMFGTKGVAVKMLPFDNKNEFQVVIDMPEGTTLERTKY